jgi:hypothetical protein
MKLDCVRASDWGRGNGWVIIDTQNGGIVAHSQQADSGFAWMAAAHALAQGISHMQLTIHNLAPQPVVEYVA